MPRREIPFIPDQFYHFYNRGNNRQTVFFERDNYIYFLNGIKKYLLRHVEVLAYCLMPNHYHMLVRVLPAQPVTPDTSEVFETSEVSGSSPVSRGMQKLLISYTKAINKRYDRVGALFQGQFQSKYIEAYPHLLHLCIYIHANPVKDGLVTCPEEWEYSNYLEWMNLRKGALVKREFLREHFDTPEGYRRLVMEYIRTRDLPEDIRSYLQDLER